MVKLLDKSARHGSCRWLPCRFTLTSGLDSADPDDSIVTPVISKMESGSQDVSTWPPRALFGRL